MRRRLWSKFLVLLISVAAIGLSGTFFLREFMVRDFRAHLQSEMEDRILWLKASLESSYQTHGGWESQGIIDAIVRAAMMGLDIRIYNYEGALISDTEAAFNSLSPPVKERVLAFYGHRMQNAPGEYLSYPLTLGGRDFGSMEARILPPKKEAVFVERSNRFLLLSVILTGGIAIVLGIVFSRRLTRPIGELTRAASQIAEGSLETRVRRTSRDEIGTLSDTFNKMADNLYRQEMLRQKLTSNIAHELRTPFSAIRGELEGMLDGFVPMEKESLQSLYSEIGRLMKILDAVEDLSQAEASGLHLEKRKLELKTFLENIVERYRWGFQDKGVELTLECPAGLTLNADPDKLSQVIINLLSNAMRATGSGGGVVVSASRMGREEVAIACSDSGCGIAGEDLPYVFERFYRGGQGGLGLGLTIVKELVEAHGGRVEAESRPGEGSRFTVVLPDVPLS